MSLIVTDGFDHYNSQTDMQQRFGMWQYIFTGGSIHAGGRAGYGNYYGFGQNGGLTGVLATPIGQITTGFGINFGLTGVYINVVMIDALTNTKQCYWNINPASGIISFFDALGVQRGTGLNAIGNNGWYFIELQNAINKTTGTAALRVNGEPVSSFPDLTGLNTQSSVNASVSEINYGSFAIAQGGGVFMDDLYLADGTTGPGSFPNNSFLGDMRAATLFPISNNSVTWTPLANANWQEVSETAMDSDTSYNTTATSGAQDTFNFGPLDIDVNQVVGLQITLAVRKVDAGSRTIAPVLLIGGVSYVGTAVSVDVSYLYITSIWPINPHTSASWTAADINALQAGYVVVT